MFDFRNNVITNFLYNSLKGIYSNDKIESETSDEIINDSSENDPNQISPYENSKFKDDFCLENIYCPYHCDCFLHYCDIMNQNILRLANWNQDHSASVDFDNYCTVDRCLEENSKADFKKPKKHSKENILMKFYIPIKKPDLSERLQLRYGIEIRYICSPISTHSKDENRKRKSRIKRGSTKKLKRLSRFKNNLIIFKRAGRKICKLPLNKESKTSQKDEFSTKLNENFSFSKLDQDESEIICLSSKSSQCLCGQHSESSITELKGTFETFENQCTCDECGEIGCRTVDKSVSTSSFSYFSEYNKFIRIFDSDKLHESHEHKCIRCGMVSRLCKKFEEKSNHNSKNDVSIPNLEKV